VLGVAVGQGDWRAYFPIGHEIGSEDNMDPEMVGAWLRDQLSSPEQAKLGANIQYDVGWLGEIGVPVAGKLYDVQYAEALLYEAGDVSLEAIAQRTLNITKTSDVMLDWLRKWSGSTKQALYEYIYKAPPRLVGPYAEGDVDLPLKVMPVLWAELVRDGLTDLFEMECGLIPLFIAMRRAGVSVDVPKAEEASELLLEREMHFADIATHHAGMEVNFNAPQQMAAAFDKLGLVYNRTDKGNPQVNKAALERANHPFTQAVLESKKYAKARSVFIESYIMDSHVDGKVFGQFHALRGRDGGTRSGRCASSTPNLQNIPSRDEEIGPMIRGLFIPDCGHKQWRCYDFSQIEYRMLAHFARGPGADALRAQYAADPRTDYHEVCLEMVAPYAGWDITGDGRKRWRKPVKNINFGLVYGMAEYTLGQNLGLDRKAAKQLFTAYHGALPFVSETMEDAMRECETTGMMRTILGRISRFDLWVPDTREGKNFQPLHYPVAFAHYGPLIKRASTHKGLNRKLQGSAADQLKAGMLKCWNLGVFDRIGVPRLTVHDELDFSDSGEASEDDWREFQNIMETVIPLRVPVIMDPEIGPNWGHCA
jgi:DNA polymerase-1